MFSLQGKNQEGVVNFDEILKESDAFMVARGHIGMEIPVETICIQLLFIRLIVDWTFACLLFFTMIVYSNFSCQGGRLSIEMKNSINAFG